MGDYFTMKLLSFTAFKKQLCQGILALAGALGASQAADVTWSGGGSNGNWGTAQNWVGGVAPTIAGADRLVFSGTVRTAASNNFASGLFSGVAFDATAGSFFLSGNEFSVDSAGFSNLSSQSQSIGPSVNFTQSTVVSNVAGGSMSFLGQTMGLGTSTITFAGAGNTTIASNVTGTTANVIKTDAGTLTATGAWNQAGNITVRTGSFVASGSAAIFSNIQTITIGDQLGDSGGSFNVSAGAIVKSQQGLLGNVNGSAGTAVVSGGGSQWTVQNDLIIGRLGQGNINVGGGGVLTNLNGSLGAGVVASDNTGSVGVATIVGTGSQWVNLGNLTVGGYGLGILQIIQGAEVSVAGNSIVGAQMNSAASTATVDGIGSVWSTTGTLTVGGAGKGSVDVTGGGVLESGSATIGAQTGSIGAVTLSGVGSSWSVTGNQTIGEGSSGTLTINAGAVSSASGSAYLGSLAGGQGTATISGAGSGWTLGGTLFAGYASQGTVAISAGATVSAGTVVVGSSAGSVGQVVVGGTGSRLTSTGALTVGQAGTGSFQVQGGATAATGAVSIGAGAGSIGTAAVNGTGSIWNTSGNITLGSLGTGSLIVQNGGALNVNGGLGTISFGAGIGELNIGGGGSAGTLNAAAVNFGSGTGTLRFDYGGAFTFSSLLTGNGTLAHDNGATTITNANTGFNGSTIITGGVLTTTNARALGSSNLQLNGGSLAPVGNLALDQFGWTGTGSIRMSIGTTNSRGFLSVAGTAVKNGDGRFVLYDDGTFQADTTYALMMAGGGFTGYNLADLRTEFVYMLGAEFSFSADMKTLYITFPASLAPTEIDNAAPVSTPTNANFFVVNTVTTSNAPNTINSLAFNNASELRVFNNLTVTSGLFQVAIGSATITGDTVTAPNDFTKLGSGLLNILGNLVVNGIANIANGTLAVNGVMTAQQLIVQTNTYLQGNGLINADVVNNGTVSPGNSIGTLTINGNYTQSSTGTLQIEIASGSNFDRLIVSQGASLAGTLQVVGLGGYAFKYGQQFAFLQANRITGGFGSILLSNPGEFRARFVVNGEMGSILIAPTSYTLLAQNQNQMNIARALDSFIPATSGDQLTVSTALDLQSADQYPAAFDQISPAFYQSQANIALEQMSNQNQMIAQQLSMARIAGRGFRSQGFDTPLANDRDGRSVDPKDMLSTLPVDPVYGQSRWGVWAQASGNMAKVTNISQVPNYNYYSGGTLIGIDYQWNDHFITGLYGGYQGTYASGSNNSSTFINTAVGGIYATYQNKGFYADAIVGGAYNNYNSRRPIQFSTIDRTARSSANGGQFTSYLDFGYDWKWGGLTFGPLVSAQYIYTGIGSFAENQAGALNLRMDTQNVNSFRTNVGGHIAYTWRATKSVIIFPQVRATWQHEYLNGSRNISSSLDGGNGPSFGYRTGAPGTDSLVAAGGLTVQIGERWSTSAFYNVNVGRSDLFDQVISLSLDYQF